MRTCPMCAEQIQEQAVLCRHCGYRLDGQQPATHGAAGPGGTNSMAVASFVCALLWMAGIGAILGIVFGSTAKKQIAASGGREGGHGLATAGQVLGWIGLVPLVLGGAVLVAALAGSDGGSACFTQTSSVDQDEPLQRDC